MCGIAGLVTNMNMGCARARVQSMLDDVLHRGPDGEGIFQDGVVHFGHRRLSIVDLSNAGAQPMESNDQQLVITYNGEVYNHIELRGELELAGHRFRSHSDTEVILAAYQMWGERCVERFNGMWAFAIWDKRTRRVFCSRDRFGVKPFYYVRTPQGFAFGSEIRQLLPLLPERKAREDLLLDFILTGASDHTDHSFFDGVERLPAGHNLMWDVDARRGSLQRYHRVERQPEFAKMDGAEATETYGALLADAVRIRLRSDVPVGTCLSGGLDSSAVASLAGPVYQMQSNSAFSAITAVSEQADNSEERYAGSVAQAVGLNWLRVRPDRDSFAASLDAVVRAQEEPFGSTSISMQYAVMQQARASSIPVLLDGQGGDETLLGYPKYLAAYLGSQWRAGGAGALVSALRSAGKNNAAWSPMRAMMYAVGGRQAALRFRYYLWQHRYLKAGLDLPDHLRAFSAACSDDFELQRLEIERTNLPVLLRYEDKNSMAHSVETRLPFLDYRLVGMALSLPGNVKIRDGWSKWVLRKVVEQRLPRDIVWRKNKLGFEAPERVWHQHLAATMRSEVMGSPLIASLARHKQLARMYDGLSLRAQWRLFSVARWGNAFGVTGLAHSPTLSGAQAGWLEGIGA
jgi:asparagine synthase (glutamine-hydrolysing)